MLGAQRTESVSHGIVWVLHGSCGPLVRHALQEAHAICTELVLYACELLLIGVLVRW